MKPVPALRVRNANGRPLRSDGGFVLYWMTASRRLRWNFALQHAVASARELRRPVLILEALRCGYRWASDRMHRFVLDGMRDNARSAAAARTAYYPYVEPEAGHGKGLLAALASRACLVVTDDFPCFMHPRMVAAAARQLAVRLDVVDGNGLVPLRAADREYPTAYAFRRFLQKTLASHLDEAPDAEPLRGARLPALAAIPEDVLARWPAATPEMLRGESGALAALPVDHDVAPVDHAGGPEAAEAALACFLDTKLRRYAEARNQPDEDATSGLSPYLHFGHVSVHRVFAELGAREAWSRDALATTTGGQRSGFWGMSAAAEGFLDQLVTWRELGFNFCSQRSDFDRFDALPDWARRTLVEHAADRRDPTYALEDFEHARTHDPLWNAAQRQLLREGRIHNYLRMLWGKKILQWTADPEQALEVMIELNNKYALDGRDPNSYSGIFWVLGRYDRPWGPERPVFGTVRYMTSENTARKVSLKAYLKRYGPASRPLFEAT